MREYYITIGNENLFFKTLEDAQKKAKAIFAAIGYKAKIRKTPTDNTIKN